MLASAAAGFRLCWLEMSKLVKSQLQRLQTGDLASLWEEVVKGGKFLLGSVQSPSSTSSSFQQNHKIRRAKQTVPDGQYNKAIKILLPIGFGYALPKGLAEDDN